MDSQLEILNGKACYVVCFSLLGHNQTYQQIPRRFTINWWSTDNITKACRRASTFSLVKLGDDNRLKKRSLHFFPLDIKFLKERAKMYSFS